MYCKYCGYKIESEYMDAKFCNKCGKAIEYTDIVENSKTKEESDSRDNKHKNKNKKTWRLVTWIGVVAVLGLIFYLAYYFSNHTTVCSNDTIAASDMLGSGEATPLDTEKVAPDVTTTPIPQDVGAAQTYSDTQMSQSCNMTIEWDDDQDLGYGLSISLEIENNDGEQKEVSIYTDENKKFICDELSEAYIEVNDMSEGEIGKVYIDFKDGYYPDTIKAGAEIDRYEEPVMFFPVSDFNFVVDNAMGSTFGTDEDASFLVRYPTGWWGYEASIDWSNCCVTGMAAQNYDNTINVTEKISTDKLMTFTINGIELTIPGKVSEWEEKGIGVIYNEKFTKDHPISATFCLNPGIGGQGYDNFYGEVAMLPGYTSPCVVEVEFCNMIPGNGALDFYRYVDKLNSGRHFSASFLDGRFWLGDCYDFEQYENVYGNYRMIHMYDRDSALTLAKYGDEEWEQHVGNVMIPWYTIYSYRPQEGHKSGDYMIDFTTLDENYELVGFRIEYFLFRD